MDMAQMDSSVPGFVPLLNYNGTGATGGDPNKVNLNWYYQSGDMSWVLIATPLVLLQVPGFGFFYSGLARRKSALSLLWLVLMAAAVTSFQWFFWGYTLSFSHRVRGHFLGTLANFGFKGVLGMPSIGSPKVPDIVYAVYQSMFAALTASIAIGGVAERGRMLPCAVFIVLWSTLVYDPIACATWNMDGWQWRLGGIDFAGGGPVHITAGVTALAYSWMLGDRKGHSTGEVNYRPHNVTYVVIGTTFLWIGWFGMTAGSAFTASLRAAMTALVTNLAASVGGMTWCLLDYRLEGKWSVVGLCSGIVAGLVTITPGSGFVPPWAAVVFGITGATASNFGTKIKFWIRVDDSLDVFAVHAIGGCAGNILTGFFAADWIAALDGYTDLPDIVWAGTISVLLLLIIDRIPGLHLRASEQDELDGIDEAELGEFAYDYVELNKDIQDNLLAQLQAVPTISRPFQGSKVAQ